MKSLKDVYKFFINSKKWHEHIYLIIYYLAWILYILSILGIYSFGKNFFIISQFFIKIYIALFLIIRFNPIIHNKTFSDFDKTIAFQAGFFILSTTIISQLINYYLLSI